MNDRKLARIAATATYLPSKRLTNKELEGMVETDDEWIVTRTGIRERRIAREDEHASDMGAKAAENVLDKAGLDPSEVDLIIVATTTPDFLFPSTAALIQAKIGCRRAAAFDFQAACPGYLYGLSIAKGMVESGSYRNVLLIATEKLSAFVDYTDRSTCILFGDGAAASLITREGRGLAIECIHLGTDGHEAMLTSVPAGGCRAPASSNTVAQGQHFIQMQGRQIFKHAVRRMADAMDQSLEQMGLAKEQIAWLVPHQANVRIIQSLAKRFGLDPNRVYLTVHKYGNTSASSIPIALAELQEEHALEKESYLMMPSFGAGLTWGNAILRVVEE